MPGRSESPARAAACTWAAGTVAPSTPGRARVAVAEATTVGTYPRLNPLRAVELMHMCVMNPASTRSWVPSSRSPSAVCTNALGKFLTTISSPSRGATELWIAPIGAVRSYGLPAPASCWMWITLAPAERARSSSVAASSSAGSTFSRRITPSV